MRFDLIKGNLLSQLKLACNDIDYYSTIKVNISYVEAIDLPTTSYTFTNNDDFVIFGWNYGLKQRILTRFDNKGLYLKLEGTNNGDKFALVDRDSQYYYYYCNYNSDDINIAANNSITQYASNNRTYVSSQYLYTYNITACKVSYLSLKDSKVLIDPKDIISSKDIRSILSDLRKFPDRRLEIEVGKNFLREPPLNNDKSVNIWSSSYGDIGILNNIIFAYNVDNGALQLFSQSLNKTKVLEDRLFNCFMIERSGNSYIGCLSDESGECKNFYTLTPGSFTYDNSNLHPYYYYMENMYDSFHNMKVNVNFKDFEELKQKVRSLEKSINTLNFTIGQVVIEAVKGEKGEPGTNGVFGFPGEPGPRGEKGDRGWKGEPGLVGKQGNIGKQGLKGDSGTSGKDGSSGTKGNKGDIGPIGPQGLDGKAGTSGSKGDQGNAGPKGNDGTPGMQGTKGRTGSHGLKGEQGEKGPKGERGDVGLPGVDGVNAAVAEQFFSEINQTKIEIQNVQKEVEANKNASENFAKEAQDAKNETKLLHDNVVKLQNMTEIARKKAKEFAGEALQSRQDTEALSSNIKEIFCKMEPADQVCSTSRHKREVKKDYYNPLISSGANKPTSFISNVINFFYPVVGQDKYRLENKIQELEQAAKAVDAAEIVRKFEKVLQKTAKNCGMQSLNFNPIELQSIIIDKQLLNDEKKLLETLLATAKEACKNCPDKSLSLFESRMRKGLADRLQQRNAIDIKKVSIDSKQPRSFVDNAIVYNPSNVYAVDGMPAWYLN